jgi:hypothetical protein
VVVGRRLFAELLLAGVVVSTTINIKSNSYRLRKKVKAGHIREPEVEESQEWTGG